MNDRTNYRGHFKPPQGIVFRKEGSARFSPYMWLNHADYEAGQLIKLDFGQYDVVMRSDSPKFLNNIFEAITRHECTEISENGNLLSIEIIEKEEEEPAGA